MATATKKVHAARTAARGTRDVREPASLEFLVHQDNGGDYHWEIVGDGGESLANQGASPATKTRSAPHGASVTTPARRGSSPAWPKSTSSWPCDVRAPSQLHRLSYSRARERSGDRAVGGQLPDLWRDADSGPVPLWRGWVPLV